MSADDRTIQFEIYRSMSPAERVSTGCALHDFALERMKIHLRRKHPERSDREILVAAARRFLGDAATPAFEDPLGGAHRGSK
jgi:hypothetical protein